MGTWGTGLYSNDTVADLRDDFRDIVRVPWDAEQLLRWVLDKYEDGSNAGSEDYTDIRLGIADLFWRYGIEHPETFEIARRIVDEDTDITVKRALGMSERDVKRRGEVLRKLAEKWSTPNLNPRSRKILKNPQSFVLETGDCLLAPTSKGHTINPYFKPAEWEECYVLTRQWVADGWATAIVLAQLYQHEIFARYLVANLWTDGEKKPVLDDFASMTVRHSLGISGRELREFREIDVVSTSALHLKRMQVDVVGQLQVDSDLVSREFPRIRRSGETFRDTDLASAIDFQHDEQQVQHPEDRIARYLL